MQIVSQSKEIARSFAPATLTSPDTGLAPDLSVAIRMDESNTRVYEYFILPMFGMQDTQLRLRQENGLLLDSYRFDTPETFFALAERINLREAA